MRRRLITSLLLAIVVPFLWASPVSAQTPWGGKNAGDCTWSYDGVKNVATLKGLECMVANILAVAVTLVGIAAFVMFLVGGFKFLTAGANAKGVESGKQAITYAILGIVIALGSFLFLRTVAALTGTPGLLIFRIQAPAQ